MREAHEAEFVGKSLHDTLHQLLLKGDLKLAEKLKTEYKVPERRSNIRLVITYVLKMS